MRRLNTGALLAGLLFCAVSSVVAVKFNLFYDLVTQTAPANPGAGLFRVYGNSSTGKLACLDSAGADCMPSGGGGGGGSTRGLFASAPACNGGSSGSLYYTTDSPLVAQCNGSSYQWRWGQIIAVPTSTAVASLWLNQSSATAVDTVGGVLLTGTAAGSSNIQARLQTVPATPYTYIVCMTTMQRVANFSETGVLWTDGTNAGSSKLVTSDFASIGAVLKWAHDKYNTVASFNSSYTANAFPEVYGLNSPVCWGLQDSGTTRKVAISYDKQIWFTNGYAGEGSTDFLTPTHIGYYVNSNSSNMQLNVNVFSEEFVSGLVF